MQRLLADHTRGQQPTTRIRSPSLLAGLIVDEAGEPLVATHACKQVPSGIEGGKVRYRYYVSRALQHQPGSSATGMRIPAREIEAAVIERVAQALDNPLQLLAAANIRVRADEMMAMLASSTTLAAAVRSSGHAPIRDLVARVTVRSRDLLIELPTRALATKLKLDLAAGASPTIPMLSPVRLTRTGRAMRLIHTSGIAANAGTPDPALVRLLLQARQWWERLADGTIDIATLAREAGISRSYVSRVVRLNFLAPKLVEAIVLGHQPAMLSAARLKMADLPTEWARQAELHLAS